MTPLPRLILLTDRRACASRGRTLSETVRRAVDAGARHVILREKDLPSDERCRLGEELLAILVPVTGELGVASDAALARRLGVRWLHLAVSDPAPADSDWMVGRSCHTTTDLAATQAQHLTYATLSPVFTTSSKPGYGPALGIEGFRMALASVAPLPVYALGGIEPGRAGQCIAAGAAGVAVMGAIMAAEYPHRVTADLLSEVGERPRV